MREPLEFEGSPSIPGLLDEIHDWWFEVENIQFDSDAATLTFPIHRKRKAIDQDRLLIFETVKEYTIDDPARVGTYDIDRLEFDKPKGLLRLLSGFPLVLSMTVKSFKVRLRDLPH